MRQLAAARKKRGIAKIKRVPPKGWASVDEMMDFASDYCVKHRLTGKLGKHCQVSKWVARKWLRRKSTPLQYRLTQIAEFLRVMRRGARASTADVLGKKT